MEANVSQELGCLCTVQNKTHLCPFEGNKSAESAAAAAGVAAWWFPV